jgi:hypothetical protein
VSNVTKRKLGGLILGVAAGAVSVLSLVRIQADDQLASRAAEEPKYYVDGARPIMDTSQPHTTSEAAELCVPYSPDRPRFFVCKEQPADWEPPPAPYFDKPTCEAALSWMGTSEEYASEDVDANSCFVSESDGGQLWDVIFPRTGGDGNVHVPFDPAGMHPLVAHP